MHGERGRRSLWLTVPLYAVLLSVLVLDAWATWFWTRVGRSLGGGLATAGMVVALLLAALVLVDMRRQWLLSAPMDDTQEE
jgi:hypothetical protein